jgi:hypothetical protein
MIRPLTIIAAIAALAVSAAPASAARDNNPFTLDMAKKQPSPTCVIEYDTGD